MSLLATGSPACPAIVGTKNIFLAPGLWLLGLSLDNCCKVLGTQCLCLERGATLPTSGTFSGCLSLATYLEASTAPACSRSLPFYSSRHSYIACFLPCDSPPSAWVLSIPTPTWSTLCSLSNSFFVIPHSQRSVAQELKAKAARPPFPCLVTQLP